MASSLESLEEKFRQVERASERRIFEKSEFVDPSTEPRKHLKKPGVSISQFGQPEEGRGDDGLRPPRTSPLSTAASRSTFYHNLARPISVDSLVSANSKEATRHAEEQHEIEVERIVGRQTLPKTVGALLPRRLTRAQSQLDYVSKNKSMVIDVSVETTTESIHSPHDVQTSTAYATRPPQSRSRAATMDILTAHGGLLERAKDLARKLRRKSRAELS